jgi:hypothetical protein
MTEKAQPKPRGLKFFNHYEEGDLVRLKTEDTEHHVSGMRCQKNEAAMRTV